MDSTRTGTEDCGLPVRVAGRIDFRCVATAYGSRPALGGPDLTVLPGERVALTGPNGAGKSTSPALIAGLYSPTLGSVAIDGRATTELPCTLEPRSPCRSDAPPVTATPLKPDAAETVRKVLGEVGDERGSGRHGHIGVRSRVADVLGQGCRGTGRCPVLGYDRDLPVQPGLRATRYWFAQRHHPFPYPM
ncbi:ATP-binding cassette domain-containing protein [Streptomyces sp. BE133]|uniref:ATP-binding cassette domain-containing protein n=1 Tax=Streptomyces sp. BE133 TaxID=3002523 RepID=UPI002E799C3A|nr:ATP-binding cassette domain-containing protein [Streptomyces sp. BE133]MEE1812392.1 ATP-binding cassette domain-containing protein [Streptomyces sp. BE133]